MSRSNAALRIAKPALDLNSGDAEAQPVAMNPTTDRIFGVPDVRTAESAALEAERGAEIGATQTNKSPSRDLVAGRATRPPAGGEPRHPPGPPTARIYLRGRSPTQSGRARESIWLLTFEPEVRTEIDVLMGWTSSRDTLQQVELRFATLDEAVAFAKRRKIHYVVEAPRKREVRPKSYADNFRHDQLLPWTH
jgi:hypothetical protein